ncbi:TPA: hypothetical protein ACN74Z_003823 [Klebsiella pneumoniae]|uniref:hypothetical protein n=1 Tax=Klebsiella TaxID=570 RepID=UPI00147A235A|nr:MULTISPECIES: hypothetical protein [Klebsiella]HDS9207969.1 hypothetical protein [Klebsiella pneumoniae subsp. pneumoniae]ELA0373554.1 hypothetical protein [Klebsiella pneumoniae]MBO3268188.1 hypothetical protein [Klebsiella sp. KBG1]MDK7033857.1 hypothetical protein [Klebsiella pneumoniae]MDS0470353.1 hypothetical protein [Klebsiella pneumoniae]
MIFFLLFIHSKPKEVRKIEVKLQDGSVVQGYECIIDYSHSEQHFLPQLKD